MMRAGDCDWRAVHLLWRDPGHIMCDNNYNDIVGPLKRALEQQGLAKAAVGHLGEPNQVLSAEHAMTGSSCYSVIVIVLRCLCLSISSNLCSQPMHLARQPSATGGEDSPDSSHARSAILNSVKHHPSLKQLMLLALILLEFVSAPRQCTMQPHQKARCA